MHGSLLAMVLSMSSRIEASRSWFSPRPSARRKKRREPGERSVRRISLGRETEPSQRWQNDKEASFQFRKGPARKKAYPDPAPLNLYLRREEESARPLQALQKLGVLLVSPSSKAPLDARDDVVLVRGGPAEQLGELHPLISSALRQKLRK